LQEAEPQKICSGTVALNPDCIMLPNYFGMSAIAPRTPIKPVLITMIVGAPCKKALCSGKREYRDWTNERSVTTDRCAWRCVSSCQTSGGISCCSTGTGTAWCYCESVDVSSMWTSGGTLCHTEDSGRLCDRPPCSPRAASAPSHRLYRRLYSTNNQTA